MTFEELMKCHPDNRKVYEKLLARFEANRVVPLFGAGMSVWAGYPKWEALLLEFCGKDAALKEEVEAKLAANDYEGAAGSIEAKKATFRRMLANKFNETGVDERKRPEYQRLFPKLFRGVLLTTNFDQVIEALYSERMVVVNPADAFDAARINTVLQGGNKQPVLLKLHGDMGDPQHIVLTQKDYDDAYGADADKPDLTKPMPKYLDKVLSSNAVLFLGSSLQTDRTAKMVKCFCANQGLTHFAVMALAKDGTARTDLHDWGIETIWFPGGMYDETYGALFNQLAADLGIGEADDRAFLPVRDLVGREKEVEEVREYWETHQEPLAPLVWVSGPGGIGKTELCKAVCVKLAGAGRKAFIPMSDLTTLEGFYAKVLTTLGQDPNKLRPDELAGKAAKALENCCKGGVAYFDNAEDLYERLEQEHKTADEVEWREWLNGLRAANIGVVVSSRETTLFVNWKNCEEWKLTPLANCAAKALFNAVLGRAPEDHELADYNWLIGQLEGYPLAIVLVALQTRARGYFDRTGWDKAAQKVSPDDKASHISVAIALQTSWEAIQQEPQAVELWGVFHMSVVPLGVEVLKGLVEEKSSSTGWEKLRSLGLVYRVKGGTVERFNMFRAILKEASLRVKGGTVERFNMLNPIKRQFPILAGEGAVEVARKRWLAYLRFLLPCADQTGVPKVKRVDCEQECDARRTVHGLLPQVWRLLEVLCDAKEADATVELMRLAGNFFSDDVNSAVTLEVLRGFFQGKSKWKKDFAFATRCLGDVRRLRSEYDKAEEAYDESAAISREIGCRRGEAKVFLGLGHVWRVRGENAKAEKLYDKSLAICREIGDRLGEANALEGLGFVRWMRDEYDGAGKAYKESLTICREIDDRLGEANALRGVGDVRWEQDEYDGAVEAYEESLAIYRKIGDRLGEAYTLRGLGDVWQIRGEKAEVEKVYEESLAICRKIRDRPGEANALDRLGDVRRLRGENDKAEEAYEEALAICQEIGYRLGEANALLGVGKVRRMRGENGKALEAFEMALKIGEEIGYEWGCEEAKKGMERLK